jgi:hypothetical protein
MLIAMYDAKVSQETDDKRILLAKLFTALALVGSMFGIFTADISADDQVILTLMVSVLALLIFVGFILLRHNKSASLILALLSIYIWVAYPIKLILMIHDPMSSWVSYYFFQAKTVQNEISGAFYTVFPGIIALFLGFLAGRNNIPNEMSRDKYVLRHHYFISIIVCLMLLKIFIQTFWDIGLPGVRPQAPLPIPFLTGLLDMLTRPVLFAIVNVYFYCVLRFRERRGLLIAVSLLLINILLALRVGWKSELVLQGVLVIYYVFDLYEYLPKKRRRFVAITSILIMIATINLYTFINDYRDNILSGKTMSEAIAKAETKGKKSHTSFSLNPIFDRINGIGEYYAAIKLGAGKDFPLDSLLNHKVMDLILDKLYGPDKHKAVTAFGTTQFSVLYLIGGVPFLIFGCFIIGWSFRWISMFIRKYILSSTAFNAYLPMLCILWVKVLSSGGEIPLFMKELILVVSFLYFVERLCYEKEENVTEDDRPMAHTVPSFQ